MIFVFDVDDTLSETDTFSEQFVLRFFEENNLPYSIIDKNARYADQMFDWDEPTAIDWYKTYGDEMTLNFPCKPFVVDIINKLHDEGHTIIIATARDTVWHSDPAGVTINWLVNNKIKFDKLYFGRTDKEQICVEEQADFFIDDDYSIYKKVLEKSAITTPILALTRHNKTLVLPKNTNAIEDMRGIIGFIRQKQELPLENCD